MTKEELLKQCRYYKGEEKCPSTYISGKERELWAAEYMICNDLSCIVSKKNLRRSFVTAVCAYVEKWIHTTDMRLLKNIKGKLVCYSLLGRSFSLL